MTLLRPWLDMPEHRHILESMQAGESYRACRKRLIRENYRNVFGRDMRWTR